LGKGFGGYLELEVEAMNKRKKQQPSARNTNQQQQPTTTRNNQQQPATTTTKNNDCQQQRMLATITNINHPPTVHKSMIQMIYEGYI